MNYNNKISFNISQLSDDTYIYTQQPLEKLGRDLEQQWRQVCYKDIISDPSNLRRLQQLASRIKLAEGKGGKIHSILQRIEELLSHAFASESIAHQHLLLAVGNNSEEASLYHDIRQHFDTVKEAVNLRLMFQIFSDDWGSGRTDPFGKEWEGYQQAPVLRYYSLLDQGLPDCPVFSPVLSHHYKEAYQICKELELAQNGSDVRELCQKMIDKIKHLQPECSLFVPGGWSGLPKALFRSSHSGHALIYQVGCDREGSYYFRILNSGAGLKFHTKGKKEDHYQAALEWGPLSEKTILKSEFWEGLFDAKVVPNVLQKEDPYYDEEYIYRHIQNHLNKECSQPKCVAKISDLQQQRAGTCTRKSADLIGRVLLSDEQEYKHTIIAKNTIALVHLSLLIEGGTLSPSENQLAHEIFDKAYRKLWDAMVKYVDAFGLEAAHSFQPYAATLQEMKQHNFQQRLNNQQREQNRKDAQLAQFPAQSRAEIAHRSREITRSALPNLETLHEVVLPTTTPPSAPLNNATLAILTQQLRSVADAGLSMMEGVTSEFLVAYLEEALFSRLPAPDVTENCIWQQSEPCSPETVIPFVTELYRAVNLSFNASQWMQGALPPQIVSFWKCYAIATSLMRRHCHPVNDNIPVSWAHFAVLCNHPSFSLFAGKRAEETSVLQAFFEKDSPGGSVLLGQPKSDEAWSAMPLFDYSWTSGEKAKVALTPEHGNSPKSIEQEDLSKILMSLWSQLSIFAQRSICCKASVKNYVRDARALDTIPRSGFSLEDARFTDPPRSYITFAQSDIDLSKSEVHPDIHLWPRSNKLSSFEQKLLKNKQLEQAEVIREKNRATALSSQENYALELISTSAPELQPHLLLSFFEERSDRLHQKEYLHYFMAHLYANDNVAQALKREPLFLERLLRFLEKITDEDLGQLTSEGALDRLLYALHSLSYLKQTVEDFDHSQSEPVNKVLDNLRARLLSFELPKSDWQARLASFLLASYSIAPKNVPELSTLLHLNMQGSMVEQKSAFDRLVRIEALAFVQKVLSGIPALLDNPEQRKQFFKTILLSDEASLAELPVGAMKDFSPLSKVSAAVNGPLKDWKVQRENYFAKLKSLAEWAQEKGSEERMEYVREQILRLEKELEEIKGKLPTVEEEIALRDQLLVMLERLPETWLCHEHQVLIRTSAGILEIDLSQGLIYRNGVPHTQDKLPPRIQQQPHCAIFGEALKGHARLCSEGFKLTHKGFENVTFKTNENRDVMLTIEGKQYLLLELEQLYACNLPECLKNSALSLWAPTEKADELFVLCGHDEKGSPKPLYFSDLKGHWHPIADPKLTLCKQLPADLCSLFKGICLNPHEVLAWGDCDGKVQSLQLTLSTDGKGVIHFTEKDGLWHWNERPSFYVAKNQELVELPHDTLHLTLESASGKKLVIMEKSPMMKLFQRAESNDSKLDVLQLKEKEKKAEVYPLRHGRLTANSPSARLNLAYRKLVYADYRGVKELLDLGLHSVGRPYTADELMLIKNLIESHSEKADSNGEAAVLRLRLMFEFMKHLQAYPIDLEGIGNKCKEFVIEWSPLKSNINAKGSTARGRKIHQMYQAVKKAARQADKITLDSCFSPLEEIEFLSLLSKEFGITNFYEDHRLRQLLGSKTNPSTANNQPTEIEGYHLPKVQFRNDLVPGKREYGDRYHTLFDLLHPAQEKNWETDFFSWPSEKMEHYFRSIYNTVSTIDKSPEGLAKKKKLRHFLKQHLLATKFQDKPSKIIIEKGGEVWQLILYLSQLDDGSALPQLPPLDRYRDLNLKYGYFTANKEQKEKIHVDLEEFSQNLKAVLRGPTELINREIDQQIPAAEIPEAYCKFHEIEKSALDLLREYKGYHQFDSYVPSHYKLARILHLGSLGLYDLQSSYQYLRLKMESFPKAWLTCCQQEQNNASEIDFDEVKRRLHEGPYSSLCKVLPDLDCCRSLDQVLSKIEECKKHLATLEALDALITKEEPLSNNDRQTNLIEKIENFKKDLRSAICDPATLKKSSSQANNLDNPRKQMMEWKSELDNFEEKFSKRLPQILEEQLQFLTKYDPTVMQIHDCVSAQEKLPSLKATLEKILDIVNQMIVDEIGATGEETQAMQSRAFASLQEVWPNMNANSIEELLVKFECKSLKELIQTIVLNLDDVEKKSLRSKRWEKQALDSLNGNSISWYAPKSFIEFGSSVRDLASAREIVKEAYERLEGLDTLIDAWEKVRDDVRKEELKVQDDVRQEEEYKKFVTAERPPEVVRILDSWQQMDPIVESNGAPIQAYSSEMKKRGFHSLLQHLNKEGLGLDNMTETYDLRISSTPLIDTTALKTLSSQDRMAIQSVVDDLQSYRAMSRQAKQYRLRPEAKEELLTKSNQLSEALQKETALLEGEILMLANTLPIDEAKKLQQIFDEQGVLHSVLDIDTCIGLALRNSVELWQSKTTLTSQQIDLLQGMILTYLAMQTEIQHLERGLQLLRSKASSSEELGQWLTEERAYDLAALADGQALHHLVFEYYSNKRVRPEQKNLIDTISALPLGPDAKGLALQLIMGAGKSKLIGPILAAMAADGEKLSTFCFPNALYATGLADLSALLYNLFRIRCLPFEFSRKSCNLDTLHQVITKFEKARLEGSVVVHRPKDLHCLNLTYIEKQELIYQKKNAVLADLKSWLSRHPELEEHDLTLQSYVLSEQDTLDLTLEDAVLKTVAGFRKRFAEQRPIIERYEQEIELLRQILLFLQNRQDALFDEFDTIFDPKNQVSFPIGASQPVSLIGVHKACDLYFSKLPRYEAQLCLASNMQTLVDDDTLSEVRKNLEEEYWNEYAYRFKDNKEGFLTYLRNEDTPSARKFHKTLAHMRKGKSVLDQRMVEEIAFLKWTLSKGLGIALQADGHVGYERSIKETKLEVVIPCEYNGTPKEGTRFKSPWEAVLKTCQYYRQNWNDPQQTARFISYTLGTIESEDHSAKETLETLFGELALLDVNDPDKLAFYTKTLSDAIQGNGKIQQDVLKLISRYLGTIVIPMQIKRDPVQLTSSPPDLSNIPGSVKGFSGTRYCADAWPTRVKATSTPHTDAVNIDVLTEKENEVCLICPAETSDLIDYMICQKDFKKASACIDVAPLFKGESNLGLAKKFLERLQSPLALRAGIDKKAVAFYMQTPDGNSTLALLKQGESEPVALRDTDKKTLKEALGDIRFEQVVTLYDHAHTVGSDIFQHEGAAAYVMIGDQITKDRFLQGVARMRALARRGHTVKCIIPHAIAEKIAQRLNKKAESLKTSDIICYAALIQQDKETPINGYSLRENLYFALKKAVRERQLHAKSSQERQSLYERFRPYLVTLQKDSLFEELGQLDADRNTTEILHQDLSRVIAALKELGVDKGEALKEWLDKMLQEVSLPAMLSSKLELTEGSVEIEQTVAAEEETQQQKMQEIRLETDSGQQQLAKEKEWPKDLTIEGLFEPSELGTSKTGIPALYRLSDCHPSLEGVFNDNLLVSENFLVTFEESSNTLFTETQKDVHHLLLVQLPDQGQKAVLVTTAESKFFIEELSKQRPTHLLLVEPSGQVIQQGGRDIAPEYQLLIQAMFFHADTRRLSKAPFLEELRKWVKERGDEENLRALFEKILGLKADDLEYYLSTPTLRIGM